MRLGLMSEQKLCALMNSCSDYDRAQADLTALGAQDLRDVLANNLYYGYENAGDAGNAFIRCQNCFMLCIYCVIFYII